MLSEIIRIAVWCAVAAACLGVLITAASLEPDSRGFGTHEGLGMSRCGYLASTGRPCITCGMTTSFSNSIRGRLPTALRASPAGVLLFLLTGITPIWIFHALATGRPVTRFYRTRLGPWALPTLIIAIALSWWYKLETF